MTKNNHGAKVIVIANNKGGCAKTCTTINLSAALRLKGFRVLAVDLDGQTNLTTCLGLADCESNDLYHAMKGQRMELKPTTAIESANGLPSFDILAGSGDLSALSTDLADDPEKVLHLTDVIEPYRKGYDYIIIDTPPAIDLLTINALYCSDAVIMTMAPQRTHLEGVFKTVEVMNTIADNRGREIPSIALLTLYDKRKGLHTKIADAVRSSGLKVFATEIREAVAVGESNLIGKDIFSYSPRSKTAEDYRNIAEEFLKWDI